VYEVYLGIVAAVDHILYKCSLLAVVIGDDIWQYKEVDGEVKKDNQQMNVPGLSAIVLYGCGSQPTYTGNCKGMTLWTPIHAHRLLTTPSKPYNIPRTSPATPNIVLRLQRSLQNFRDLHGSSDTFRHLSPPSGCLIDLAPQWGPEKMDKEIDP
jgi:hypothetical protein